MSKAGRPPGREFPVKLQTHVTEDMDKELEYWAAQTGEKTTDFVRKAIQQRINLLKEWAEENPTKPPPAR